MVAGGIEKRTRISMNVEELEAWCDICDKDITKGIVCKSKKHSTEIIICLYCAKRLGNVRRWS